MRRSGDKISFLDAGRQARRSRTSFIVTFVVILLAAVVVTILRLGYFGGTTTSSASYMSTGLISSAWSETPGGRDASAESDTTEIEWSRCPLLWPEEEGRISVSKAPPRSSDPTPWHLRVSGIIQGKEGAYAFINGKAVSVGDVIDGFRIVEIDQDHVRVSPLRSSKTHVLKKKSLDPIFDQSEERH